MTYVIAENLEHAERYKGKKEITRNGIFPLLIFLMFFRLSALNWYYSCWLFYRGKSIKLEAFKMPIKGNWLKQDTFAHTMEHLAKKQKEVAM